jgi:hypothetical protein
MLTDLNDFNGPAQTANLGAAANTSRPGAKYKILGAIGDVVIQRIVGGSVATASNAQVGPLRQGRAFRQTENLLSVQCGSPRKSKTQARWHFHPTLSRLMTHVFDLQVPSLIKSINSRIASSTYRLADETTLAKLLGCGSNLSAGSLRIRSMRSF